MQTENKERLEEYFKEDPYWIEKAREMYIEKVYENSTATQNVNTPESLCKEMVGKLRENCELKGKKILTLNPEFVTVLGNEDNDITFLSDCPKKTRYVKGFYPNVKVIEGNFLEMEMNMKFDCVIGNPPYQDNSAKSSKKTWNRFLEKAIDICEEKGFIAFITPFSWATPSNESFSIFKTYDVEYINLDGKKYFPNVGTTISWYIIRKQENRDKTIICSEKDNIEIDLKQVDFLPVKFNKISLSIVKKILPNSIPIGIKYDYFCEQRKPIMSKIKTASFIYPVKHTSSQNLYSNIPHPNTQVKKVIFPISSAMKAEYDEKGEFGCSQHYAWIEVKSKEQAESLISFLNSNIISFLRIITQWTASWSRPILDKIPQIPLNIKWTNEKLYSLFNLNKEEIEYIEKIVK